MCSTNVHAEEIPVSVRQEIIGGLRKLLERQIDFT